MDIIDLCLLSFALGLDCLVVSFSQGLIFVKNRRKNSLKLAVTMGLFQGLMPIIGYVAANKVYDFIVPYSKWIVFTIFFVLGLNFILESFRKGEKEEICRIGFGCLIALGIATGIDALVSGVTLKLTSTVLLNACLIIGAGSFIMSQIGFWSGNVLKNLQTRYLHILGGLILIGLALKALI
ncbi:MAG TPA: hypothetical protein DEO94_05290 [Cyanobacteria bacterium UBA11991]|nr:manganese efflux pump [Cyanobacteriota bacterium]MDY6357899.1 manganese efflux pump [Cyanobacteriota bacterium]MDY6363276.1 manganese efflux pump [Cyanobacteriota bacterium]MDY6382303.1 manganese efflux pump [Cyanobacteriota bacterium]HCB11534.1 hypothetical protein [Cyanobacteria bacterium UBA11991]